MDPGRFVSHHQQHFLILGFHDDERSDSRPGHNWQQDHLVTPGNTEEKEVDNNKSHHLRLNFGRNTLSPVREHQDVGGSGDLVALMQQRVNSVDSGIRTAGFLLLLRSYPTIAGDS